MTEASTDAAAGFTQGLPFNRLVGLRIDTAREGQATGRLEIREEVHNHIGTIHAAAQFALIEALSGAATMSNLQDLLGRVTPLVEGIDVSYHKLLRGDAHGVATVATDSLASWRRSSATGRLDSW
ncbi:MAG: DUF4442 domain-containing protein [Candidatus Dormibacteraeota bacterium]|nr:DUF4442 domain-containing protein [Candidatus Dormibacteraeota bacterium]